MSNLSEEAKLLTPGGAITLLIVGGAFCVWYFDIDVWEHLRGLQETIRYVTGGILG